MDPLEEFKRKAGISDAGDVLETEQVIDLTVLDEDPVVLEELPPAALAPEPVVTSTMQESSVIATKADRRPRAKRAIDLGYAAVNVRLRDDLYERLNEAATSNDVWLAEYVRQAVETFGPSVVAKKSSYSSRSRRAASSTRFSMRFPTEQKRDVEGIAQRTGRSQNEIIVLSVKAALESAFVPTLEDE